MTARPDAKAFVDRFHKVYPGRDPSSEVSLNYTAVHATALAMKLAGTTTDGVTIRAQIDKAFKTLPTENNPQEIEGVDDKGGTVANVRWAWWKAARSRSTSLRAANAAK